MGGRTDGVDSHQQIFCLHLGNVRNKSSFMTMMSVMLDYHLTIFQQCFRYHDQSGIYETVSIKKSLDMFELHGTASYSVFEDLVNKLNTPLSFEKQEELINSLSNDSAPDHKKSISHDSYFSASASDGLTSKYPPTSIRNKAIYYKRTDNISLVSKSLFSEPNHKRSVSQTSSSPGKTSRTKRQKLETNRNESVESVIISPSTFDCKVHDASPFSEFSRALVGDHGVLKWRIHSLTLDIVVMNDVCLDSGNFQKNSFVHVTRVANSVYFCTCRMFTAGSRMQSSSDHSTHCCHVRFFAETINARYEFLFSKSRQETNLSKLDNKLISSLDSLNVPLVKLDCHKIHHRFSVISKDFLSVAFVYLNDTRFSCMDGNCRASSGHSRKVALLGDSGTCEHLQVMDNHRELWEPLEGEREDTSLKVTTKVPLHICTEHM